jgi:hypothetical protein
MMCVTNVLVYFTDKLDRHALRINLVDPCSRYLPLWATFAPPTAADGDEKAKDDGERKAAAWGSWVENVSFSQLGCNAIFVIVICITERRRIRNDPLNFSLLKIMFEVVRCVLYSISDHVSLATAINCHLDNHAEAYGRLM